VLEREAAVARDVVGVRVRLERPDEVDVPRAGLLDVRLDRVRGVDDDREAGRLVADQVGRAAEVVVDELAEEHRGNVTPGSGRVRGKDSAR
jgi:hypothetical protein